MARKNSKKPIDINEISYEYGIEEDSLDDVIVGIPVASFSFGSNTRNETIESSSNFTNLATAAPINNREPHPVQPISQGTTEESINTYNKLIDHRVGKPTANGVTPPIDGESFAIKRTYAFRESTIRKLNELKASHTDVNVYLSTILDEAITYYHNHIFQGPLKK